jgi:hypothetical protein
MRRFVLSASIAMLTAACGPDTLDPPDEAGAPEGIESNAVSLLPTAVFGRLYPSGGTINSRNAPTAGTWLGGWNLSAADDVLPFTGDFDGDGQDEVVIRSGWGLGILANNGSGSWTAMTGAPYGTVIGSLTLRADDTIVGVGRFGSDIRASLIVQGLTGITLLQVSAGSFVSRAYFPYGTRIGGWLLSRADKIHGVGRSGSGDAFFITSPWGMGVLQIGAGSTGTSLAMVTTSTVFGRWTLDSTDPALRFVKLADVDGDGTTELVVQSAGGIAVLGVSGSFVHRASFAGHDRIAGVARPLDSLAAVADFNRDGHADFLFQTAYGIRVVGTTDASWTFRSIASHPYGTWISSSWNFGSGDTIRSVTGDFDGDNQTDFVIESGWGIGTLSVSGSDVRVVGMRYRPDLPVAPDYYLSNDQTVIAAGHFDRASVASDILFHSPYTPPVYTTRPAVLTQHNDNARTGQFLQETSLSPSSVRTRGMSKCVRPTDAAMTTQALYVPDLTIAGVRRDVVYAATINNTIYAFDANNVSGCGTSAGQLWSLHLTDPVNPTARPAVWLGIGATPVIDLARKTMYVVYGTAAHTWATELEDPTLDAHYWLAALDLETGAVRRTVKIAASYPRSDGSIARFNASNQNHRAALLLDHGSIYVAFAMRHREEQVDYHGWVMRYDALSFDQLGAFSTTPNQVGGVHGMSAGQGAGIWQGGGGLVADERGNIYFMTGNAVANPAGLSYGNQYMKMSPVGRTIQLTGALDGSSIPSVAANTVHGADTAMHLMDLYDIDLGAGGPTFVPGTNQLFGGGKAGAISLINRDTFRRAEEFYAAWNTFDTAPPGSALNEANRYNGWDGSPHLHGSSTFWRGADPSYGFIYIWGERDAMRIYRYNFVGDGNTARIDTTPVVGPVIVPATDLGGGDVMPGGMMSVSSNGATHTGIVWAVVSTNQIPPPGAQGHPSELIALDAESGAVLWRGSVSSNPHWACPTVAAGKVFVATGTPELEIFSLRPLFFPWPLAKELDVRPETP